MANYIGPYPKKGIKYSWLALLLKVLKMRHTYLYERKKIKLGVI